MKMRGDWVEKLQHGSLLWKCISVDHVIVSTPGIPGRRESRRESRGEKRRERERNLLSGLEDV